MLIYPKIQIGPASPETKQAMCEEASPRFSYWSRWLAPKGCPGRREGGKRSFGLVWIVRRIQMSHVLVKITLWDLAGLSGFPEMPRMPPIAETVTLVVGLWASRSLQVIIDKNTHSHGE